MFRPTLKRSKLAVKFESTPYNDNIQLDNVYKLISPADSKSGLTILPSACLQNYNSSSYLTSTHSKGSKVLSPLNSHDLQYPEQIQNHLVDSLQNIKNRGIGTQFGIYWLHSNEMLYLWSYEDQQRSSNVKLQRKFEFPQDIYAVAIGDIRIQQDRSQTDQKQYVMALGFKNIIDLYFINTTTLEIKDMLIKFRVDYNQILQKMKFTETNQLLFTGDEGYLTRVSFYPSQTLHRQQTPKKLLKVCEKSVKFDFSLSRVLEGERTLITEDIVADPKTDKIYVLILEQRQISEVVQKWRKLKAFFFNRVVNFENTRTSKKYINVYNVCGGKSLKYEGTIKEQSIINALKSNYTNINCQLEKMQQISDPSNSFLCSISLSENRSSIVDNIQLKKKLLTVSLKSRHIVTISEENNPITKKFSFGFADEPSKLPHKFQTKQQEQKQGFGLLRLYNQKQLLQESNQQKFGTKKSNYSSQIPSLNSQKQQKIKLLKSLGTSNINFLSNKFCYYIDNDSIQVISFSELPNQIVEITNKMEKFNKFRVWAMFSRKKIAIVRTITVQQILLTYSCAQAQLVEGVFGNLKQDIENGNKKQKQLEEIGLYNQKIKNDINHRHHLDLTMDNGGLLFSSKQYQKVYDQQRLYYLFTPLLEISNQLYHIIGKNQLCKGICEILCYIIGQKAGCKNFNNFNPSKVSNGLFNWEKFPINSDLKHLAKRQLEVYSKFNHIRPNVWPPRIEQKKCLKLVDWFYSIFQQNQQTIYPINTETEDIFLRMLMTYEHLNDRTVFINNSQSLYGCYWLYLMKQVSNILTAIKKWTVYDFLNHHQLRLALVQKLQIIGLLIKTKQINMRRSFEDIYYFRQRHREQVSKKSLNTYSVNSNSTSASIKKKSDNKIEKQRLKFFQEKRDDDGVGSVMSDILTTRAQSSQSVDNLQNKIMELIPKILVSIQLYCLLGQKRREQKLPQFQNFLLQLSCRKKIKQELLKTFSNQNISQNQFIKRLHKLIPQLGLKQDLLFEKWFGHLIQSSTSQQHNNKLIEQIRKIKPEDYDYRKISSSLTYEHLRKLQTVFLYIPDCYIRLLLNRFKHIDVELNILQKSQNIRKGMIQQSIFDNDHEKFHLQLLQQLYSEQAELKLVICSQSQNIVRVAHRSRGQQFLQHQKWMNSTIKQLQQFPDTTFIEHLYNFMRSQNLFIEKVYDLKKKLARITNKDFLGKISKVKQQNTPQMMSSLRLCLQQEQNTTRTNSLFLNRELDSKQTRK